jgi:hypothetical protein
MMKRRRRRGDDATRLPRGLDQWAAAAKKFNTDCAELL